MGFRIVDGILQHYAEEKEVTDIIIPDTVKVITTDSFRWCRNLHSIHITENVQKIEGRAFKNCLNLKEITVDKRNRYYFVKDGALYYREQFPIFGHQLVYCFPQTKKLTLSPFLTAISYGAFADSCQLKKISVPLSENFIVDLNGILYRRNVSGWSVVRCPVNRKKVVLPSLVNHISSFAFANCQKLEAVTFSRYLDSIESLAFENCSGLKEIVFPKMTKTIRPSAFVNCTNLEKAVFYSSSEDISPEMFRECRELKMIVWQNVEYPLSEIYPAEYAVRHEKGHFSFGYHICDLISVLNGSRMYAVSFRTQCATALNQFLANSGESQKQRQFIEKHFMDIMKYLIERDDREKIQKLMNLMNSHFTGHNLLEYIMYANEKQKYEIQVILTEYKGKYIGYPSEKDIMKKFEL